MAISHILTIDNTTKVLAWAADTTPLVPPAGTSGVMCVVSTDVISYETGYDPGTTRTIGIDSAVDAPQWST